MTITQRLIAAAIGITTVLLLTYWSLAGREKLYQTTMTPQEVVEAFNDLAFVQRKPKDAVLKYVSPDVIEHNPTMTGSRDDIVAHLEKLDWSTGGPRSIIKRVLVDGDIVVVHHHLFRQPEGPGVAAIDMHRVKDGFIVEHWDVLQTIPENNPNQNGMF